MSERYNSLNIIQNLLRDIFRILALYWGDYSVSVTLLLLSWHVLGGKPKGDEEDGGDSEDSGNEGDDDDDDEEVVSSGTNTKPCNTACILVFQPVCAINSRLVVKTFSNSCILGVFNCQNKEGTSMQ